MDDKTAPQKGKRRPDEDHTDGRWVFSPSSCCDTRNNSLTCESNFSRKIKSLKDISNKVQLPPTRRSNYCVTAGIRGITQRDHKGWVFLTNYFSVWTNDEEKVQTKVQRDGWDHDERLDGREMKTEERCDRRRRRRRSKGWTEENVTNEKSRNRKSRCRSLPNAVRRGMKEGWEQREGWVTLWLTGGGVWGEWNICLLHLPTADSFHSSWNLTRLSASSHHRHLGKTITGGPPGGRYLRTERWGRAGRWQMDSSLWPMTSEPSHR